MKLSDFKYPLPRNLIASYPAKPRDSAKNDGAEQGRRINRHQEIPDLGSYVKGDCIASTRRRCSARLFGKKEKTNARSRFSSCASSNKEEGIWDVIVDPAGR